MTGKGFPWYSKEDNLQIDFRKDVTTSFRETYFPRKIISSASKGKRLIWTIHFLSFLLSPTFAKVTSNDVFFLASCS